MSVELVALLAVLSFLVLALLEVPIGLSLALGGSLGITLLRGVPVTSSVLQKIPYSATSKYVLLTVPLFVLLGSLVANAGIGERIYFAINALVRRLPGGLGAATVIATSIFSGISGSSAADVATVGRVSIAEMRRYGYAPQHAGAIVAAAGAFAVLIPPSIGLVVYGIISEESIGALLLAGIIPGVLSGIVLAAAIVIPAAFGWTSSGAILHGAPKTSAGRDRMPFAAMASGLIYAAILFIIVAGGIYTGIFTATESAGIGAFAALIMTIPAARRGGIPRRVLVRTAVREAADITSMIFLLLLGGAIFTYFIVSTRLPNRMAERAVALEIPPLALVAIFLLLMIPIGMFLDGLSAMLLIVPIVTPIVAAFGFDGIWFGILMMKMIEIGLITPPVGINVFVVSGMVKDCTPEQLFRSVAPFVLLDFCLVALLFAFPEIVTWLPSLGAP
jgi:C4-dicarboxylate transporter DctM subunit